ncbi:MAG: hypothetical protein GX868_05080 [Actinobacteria bacterium]|nr:hypothetical protein [Actinomycetota bacterium]
MTRRRLVAAVTTLSLFAAVGCGDDPDSVAVNDSDSETAVEDGDNGSSNGSTGAAAGDALERYRNASIDCGEGVEVTITMEDLPFATMATDGAQTYVEMNGASMIALFMGAFAAFGEAFGEETGGSAGSAEATMPTDEEFEAISKDMTQAFHLAGDVAYVGLPEDGEFTWYQMPADEFDSDEAGVDVDEMREMCTEGAADFVEVDADALYVDPDNADQLISADVADEGIDGISGADASSGTESTVARGELTDDEIRELRDSESRTIITLDGERVVRVDTNDGMQVLMEIAYGDPGLKPPAAATKVSGAEFETISQAHSDAVDAKYGDLFGE